MNRQISIDCAGGWEVVIDDCDNDNQPWQQLVNKLIKKYVSFALRANKCKDPGSSYFRQLRRWNKKEQIDILYALSVYTNVIQIPKQEKIDHDNEEYESFKLFHIENQRGVDNAEMCVLYHELMTRKKLTGAADGEVLLTTKEGGAK